MSPTAQRPSDAQKDFGRDPRPRPNTPGVNPHAPTPNPKTPTPTNPKTARPDRKP